MSSSPLIPPPEYQEEIKRRFTVNARSQTGLDKDGHEFCLKPSEDKYHCGVRKYRHQSKQRYYRVSVTANGKEKIFRAHNIVIWLSYGFNAIKHGYCVNHINGNGTDNRLVNLEIVPVAVNSAEKRKPHEQPRKAATKHKPRYYRQPVTMATLRRPNEHCRVLFRCLH
ncbi:HNH endonuclease [Escherichia coli]|uniref:HNH endonuclease n=1 Tax=Escherichia coli TaxID=562 RepID=UPI0020210E1B|nr:HNH endonuclease [Escherichia coli]